MHAAPFLVLSFRRGSWYPNERRKWDWTLFWLLTVDDFHLTPAWHSRRQTRLNSLSCRCFFHSIFDYCNERIIPVDRFSLSVYFCRSLLTITLAWLKIRPEITIFINFILRHSILLPSLHFVMWCLLFLVFIFLPLDFCWRCIFWHILTRNKRREHVRCASTVGIFFCNNSFELRDVILVIIIVRNFLLENMLFSL